jgi:sulfate/thiosulfate transport system ATP-binding protein
VLVRPHELEVSLTADGSGSVPATIKRINSAGSTVRLELASASGDRFDVELPHERFSLLSLSNGQAVFVRPRQMRVFAESGDYSI